MKANIYDYTKLRDKIKRDGTKEKEVADLLEISPSTLSLKLNNKAIFSQDEILKLSTMLELSDLEIKEYFFVLKV